MDTADQAPNKAELVASSDDGLPVTAKSRQIRDICQVSPELKCGMMVPVAFRYERKSRSSAWAMVLHEVM